MHLVLPQVIIKHVTEGLVVILFVCGGNHARNFNFEFIA